MQMGTTVTPHHLAGNMCWDLTERRRQHKIAGEATKTMEQTFSAYGGGLKIVDDFKY